MLTLLSPTNAPDVIDEPDTTDEAYEPPPTPVGIKTDLRSHCPEPSGQVQRQRCGGGYRILRKQIGGN